MSTRSASAMLQAYDVLISQPATANGLSSAERDAIVISAIVNEDGETLVLSRFGDSQWDLRPFLIRQTFLILLNLSTGIWACLGRSLMTVKLLLMLGLRENAGFKPPIARGITTFAVASVMPFIRWLNNLGVSSFAEIVQSISAITFIIAKVS